MDTPERQLQVKCSNWQPCKKTHSTAVEVAKIALEVIENRDEHQPTHEEC